ncbi:hypothetical protein JCM8097_005500 [Rhodosporidiobolus ruineniae]
MLLPDDKHRLEFPGVPGLYGYVTVDGAPLEVYGVEHKDGKTVAYIEAQEGKEFEAGFVDRRLLSAIVEDGYVVDYYADGLYVDGNVRDRNGKGALSYPTDSPYRFKAFRGRRTSPSTLAPLRFNTLQLTDDDEEACTDEKVIKNLGTLRLSYLRTRGSKVITPTSSFAVPAVRPVHEQAKKAAALSHRAEYGPSKSTVTATYRKCDYIDARASPFAVVEFAYRSKKLLRLQGLLPAPPSPPPQLPLGPTSPVAGPSQPRRLSATSPSPALNIGNDTLQAELESLRRQERIAQLEREARRRSGAGGSEGRSFTPSQAQKKVKRETITLEDEDDDDRERKRVKREEVDEIERRKEDDRRKGKKPEVIDLCDSD